MAGIGSVAGGVGGHFLYDNKKKQDPNDSWVKRHKGAIAGALGGGALGGAVGYKYNDWFGKKPIQETTVVEEKVKETKGLTNKELAKKAVSDPNKAERNRALRELADRQNEKHGTRNLVLPTKEEYVDDILNNKDLTRKDKLARIDSIKRMVQAGESNPTVADLESKLKWAKTQGEKKEILKQLNALRKGKGRK